MFLEEEYWGKYVELKKGLRGGRTKMRNVWSYLPPNISITRSWRMRCMGHVQITGDDRNACEIYLVHLQKKFNLKRCMRNVRYWRERSAGGGTHIILSKTSVSFALCRSLFPVDNKLKVKFMHGSTLQTITLLSHMRSTQPHFSII